MYLLKFYFSDKIALPLARGGGEINRRAAKFRCHIRSKLGQVLIDILIELLSCRLRPIGLSRQFSDLGLKFSN